MDIRELTGKLHDTLATVTELKAQFDKAKADAVDAEAKFADAVKAARVLQADVTNAITEVMGSAGLPQVHK